MNLLNKIWECLQKATEVILSFLFCVWELIIIGSIITVLCGFIFYKLGVFNDFGKTYANEPLLQIEPLKTYFYIDFKHK